MSIVSRLTVTPLLYACGILFALLLVATGTARYFHGEMKDAEQAKTDAATAHDAVVGGLNTRISTLAGANKHEQAVVKELARRLVTAVGQHQQAETALTNAIDTRDRARRERDRALSQLRQAQEANYANDETCAVWGARPVCGRITDGVLDQWQRARGSDGTGDQDGAGGNPGAAAGADRSDADRRADPRTGADAGMGLRHRGLRPAGGMLQQPAAGIDAFGRAGVGQWFGGQPALDQAGQRRVGQASGAARQGETAVSYFVVLEYSDRTPASRIVDDLHKAGAMNSATGPRPTIIADATGDPDVVAIVGMRLSERGIVQNDAIDVVLGDDFEQPEATPVAA